jgi:hypothetical protein
MAKPREDPRPEGNVIREFPGKNQAAIVTIDAPATIFVPSFAQKPWEFSGFCYILTDTS